MCQFNAYIISLVIPGALLSYINADLGPDPNSSWISISWTLGASIIVSIGGRLSDIFGRRYFMLTGSTICVVGALLGANGKNINMMIASGALLGVGAGFLELCYACVQEIVPNKHRIVTIGCMDASLAVAFVSPVVAYAFIAHQSIGWRGGYWYMFAFHVFAFLMSFLFYKPPTFDMKHYHDGKTKMELLLEIDYVGVFLFVAGSVLFLMGVNFGGRTYPWSHPITISLIIVGLLCLIAVGCWCAFNTSLKYPLFPPRLFKKFRE